MGAGGRGVLGTGAHTGTSTRAGFRALLLGQLLSGAAEPREALLLQARAAHAGGQQPGVLRLPG